MKNKKGRPYKSNKVDYVVDYSKPPLKDNEIEEYKKKDIYKEYQDYRMKEWGKRFKGFGYTQEEFNKIQEAAMKLATGFWTIKKRTSPLPDLKCTLSEKQAEHLSPLFQQILESTAQEKHELSSPDLFTMTKSILYSHTNNNKIYIRNNKLFCYLFYSLAQKGYICNDWQRVITERGCFIGKKGAKLNQRNLSTSLSSIITHQPKIHNDFIELTKRLISEIESICN